MRIRVLRGWGNVVIWAERVSRVGRVSTGCLLLSLVCSPINFPVGTTGYLASSNYIVNFEHDERIKDPFLRGLAPLH